MGYRLHYAKHYDPDWRGGFFSGEDASQFENLYFDKFSGNGWSSENEDIFEIDRIDMKVYADSLKKLDPSRKNKYMTDYTNAELAQILEDILEGTEDEIIRIEWF